MTNRAALYLRSSKDRSDVSIDAQRRALHELAVTRSLVVVDEYVDAVESGKDDDRPGFQRLLSALKSSPRPFDQVLALDTSRIARRRELALIFERECSRKAVRVVYRNVPDTDPITEMLLKSILQAMDEWHSLTSKQKGLAGMAENVRQGWRAGGKAPRGYRLDYAATGAIRDGVPVTKSRLVVDEDAAGEVAQYLKLRATGIPRGHAIARLGLRWPTSSTHSMDWQALTYAGHTVWNMHAERAGGASVTGEKRRPRADWLVQRNTHPPLISDAEAEAILGQVERAQQGRRLRASPLLLTGLLAAPDGSAWHSDGCGFYRLGKGKKIGAARLEAAVLDRLATDLQSDEAVARICASIAALDDEPIDARRLAGMEKRIGTLTTQIGRTVDLAAGLDDPAPVLRRVADLEHERARLIDELDGLRARKQRQVQVATITPEQVRALLRRMFAQIADAAADAELRAEARQAIAEVVERIELDPATLTARVHYAVSTGDKVASPRRSELSPVARWTSAAVELRRAA